MDESEIWLSEEEEEVENGTNTDPTAFTIGLTYQGQPGVQRTAVSAFHGGSKKKPAFTVSCNAKAIIHGEIDPSSKKRATFLVYEFKFNSYRGSRIKQANILFEFKPMKGQEGGPSVYQVAPRGLYKMRETLQDESLKKGIEFGLGPNIPAVEANLTLSAEASVEKVTKHYIVATGDTSQDDWGNFFGARFFLSENESQKSGIPSKLRVCILLERDDDEDFVCVPYVNVTPNFTAMFTTLFSSRSPDDPIIFRVAEPPFNQLDDNVDIDRNNLGAVDLGELWDCTEYYKYERSVK
ncbi:uncharacterized protein TRIVIDRAFT_192301 [Trichoderma virens Gv29-8]|uniref:Uncharacterized protein n=1 Tax=Hypocrea virens (strain Gv29-8 / FGSC 10586) TaxID=413071 RepID=G9MWF1_HYPVG|nr:uncharacterized protein TRIVIDRAFT_192301 [Trichoderma virens Gv29-8]EHK21287.1 hypothetical protein TRIVIDRAFT_192301 [Trichoderma virens Gv29-8]UKZ52388.1 hypothetical protein TrVGV298_006164 [Trichoderma virens]